MADVINLNRLNEATGGDNDFANELLDEFVNLLCDEVAKLARAMEAGNMEEMRFVAHALKGASASIGAEPIALAAARMELYAKEADSAALQATLIEIERQTSRFVGWYESPLRAA